MSFDFEDVWRPITGYEGLYEVSSEGNVRRVPSVLRDGRKWKGRVLVQHIDKHGYANVTLSRDNVKVKLRVHVLVCEVFHGPRPEARFAAHNDGNSLHNWPDNLRWATREENEADKIRHGTRAQGATSGHYTKPESTPRGEAHGCAVLDEAAVREIRATAGKTVSCYSIAKKFHVSKTNIRHILRRKTWKHINA